MIAFQVEFDEEFWVPVVPAGDLKSLGERDSLKTMNRHFIGFILIGEAYTGTINLENASGYILSSFSGITKEDAEDLFVCRTVDQVITKSASVLFKFTSSVATNCEIVGIFA